MAVSFPAEILLKILSRLPRKSLRRFVIVSKEWASLTKEAASLPAKSTNFGFVLNQYRRHDLIEKTIFYRVLDDNGALAVEDSISFASPFCIRMMGSCNGVVFYGKENQVNKKLSHHLYNPLTKQHSNLPPLPPFRLDHDPDPCAIGVGLHPKTNHFKLVLSYNIGRNSLEVAIFDSETGVWKMKPTKFSDKSVLADLRRPYFKFGDSALCFEQSLYWIGRSYLLLFCLKTETFRVLHLPMTTHTRFNGVLWESEGRLRYTQTCPIIGLRIWVFRGVEKTRGNWDIIFHDSIPTLNSLLAETIKLGPLDESPSNITGVSAFNEHLQMLYLRAKEGVNVCYDIPNKKMTLVSPSALDNNFALLLPFTYCKDDLPDFED